VLSLLLAGCDDKKKPSSRALREEARKPGPAQRFETRPDLKPPPVKINTPAKGTAPGYIFIGPKLAVHQAGPMIVDNRGQVVWFHPLKFTKGITDFRVQRYRGKPVLTWWRGRLSNRGVGDGWFVIYDDSYRPVAEVHAGNGLVADVHEFLITRNDTAMICIYHRRFVDLTAVGGPKEGKIWDGIVQEIDIPTGRVLFEWHSYPQVGIKESYAKAPDRSRGAKALPYDYFHLNSVDVDTDGNLLVSSRNTHTIYKVDRRSGKVLWRLGGKKSDFALGPGVRFAWQHDARRQRDGTITLFDNGAAPPVEKFSRALVLRVDTQKKRATLVRSYRHPQRLLSPFEGNAQVLPDGHVVVGWGGWPYVTEFARNGRVLFDAYWGHGKPPDQDADSYRAYRFPWKGRPLDRPAVKAVRRADGTFDVYVSWNGATDVWRWAVFAGPDSAQLHWVGTGPKTGFESRLRVLEKRWSTFVVRPVSYRGKFLRRSDSVAATG
jgi:hypothetical protein